MIDYNNYIDTLISKIPELKLALGYDEDDNDNPYVAMASLIRFVKTDSLLYEKFLKLNNNIFNETVDVRVADLIAMEIIHDYCFDNYNLNYSTYFNGKSLEECNKNKRA